MNLTGRGQKCEECTLHLFAIVVVVIGRLAHSRKVNKDRSRVKREREKQEAQELDLGLKNALAEHSRLRVECAAVTGCEFAGDATSLYEGVEQFRAQKRGGQRGPPHPNREAA